MARTGNIESVKDFANTPKGRQEYWQEEMTASRVMLKQWHKLADKINNKFLGKQQQKGGLTERKFDLNLFHSNITTLASMLYGNTPKIDVSRRYADPNDDVSRVAAEGMERLLNMDIAENGAETDVILRSALQDRLLGGLGTARVRYEMSTTLVSTDMGEREQLVKEDAPVNYVFWGDILWPWARNFTELRWIAFRNYLTRDEVEKKFGKHAADNIPLKNQMATATDEAERDPNTDGAWMKAEIWEIWDKERKEIVHFAFGYDKTLKTAPDALKLAGFYPIPPFLIANTTNALYIPTPDYALAQDLYNEIDVLQTRISILTEAVKVVGVYDKSAEGVQRMFKEGVENDLIPVDNWALFAEKGGIAGQVDWVPVEAVVNALNQLTQIRGDTIGLLQQVTGMADIMRGDLGSQYEGVGQTEMKAKFGSVRIQALQDEFAKFASDLMQLKAEVISRHFDPQTIAKRTNIQNTVDAEHLPAAVQLIKQTDEARLRITIRPESVAMVDYAQLKSERTDYINALATFLQSAGPMMENDPKTKPFLFQLLQWGLAGFKGASEIEGVVDKAIAAAMEESKEPEKPDPAEQQQQMNLQIEQMKAQAKMQEIQAKSQADQQLREQDKQADIETALAGHQANMAQIDANMQASLAETEAKMRADILKEKAQSEFNTMQAANAAGAEVQKDQVSAQLDMQKDIAKTELKLQEIAASTSAKIAEARAKPKPTGGGDES